MLIRARGGWRWEGRIRIVAWRHDRFCPHVYDSDLACECGPIARLNADEYFTRNLIVNSALNLARDVLRGAVNDAQVDWLALGDNATAPAASDTKLVNELFRKTLTTQAVGSTGEVVTTIYVAPAEAVFHIQEAGWFAAGASATKDSGVLVARVLYDRDKTDLESLQFERHDTFSPT